MSKKPYLSIVVASRNDDHSGSALSRMQLFVSTLLFQLSKYKIHSELVIVEWNPPKNKANLLQVISFPKFSSVIKVRLITVPPDIHSKYPHHNVLGLYQFIAKNVGIRRARGQYILSTNMDILFSNEIIKFFSLKKLNPDQMVRAVRCDVPSDIHQSWEVDKILTYCRQNAYRIYCPSGIKSVSSNKFFLNGFKIFSFFPKVLINIFKQNKEEGLFTNACGDFTLLSKDFWYKVHGYPEFPMHGVKIDGLLCYSAFYMGAKQLVLNNHSYIYHLNHQGSWSSENKDFELDLKKKHIPFIDRMQYAKYLNLMKDQKEAIVFNKNDWGLVSEKFKERIVSGI